MGGWPLFYQRGAVTRRRQHQRMHVLAGHTFTKGNVARRRHHRTHGLILVSKRYTRQQQNRLQGHLVIGTSRTSVTQRRRTGHVRHLRRTGHGRVNDCSRNVERRTVVITRRLLPRHATITRNRRTIKVRRSIKLGARAPYLAARVYNTVLLVSLVGIRRTTLTSSRSGTLRTLNDANHSHVVRNLLRVELRKVRRVQHQVRIGRRTVQRNPVRPLRIFLTSLINTCHRRPIRFKATDSRVIRVIRRHRFRTLLFHVTFRH